MRQIALEEYDVIIPPKIRNAFFCRRPEPFNFFYDSKTNNTKDKHSDVCSLYPTVMYYDPFHTLIKHINQLNIIQNGLDLFIVK